VTEIEPEVLQRAQAGDREAHAALYRAFAPMVYTLARRMLGSKALAEDVLQDCFVDVIRKASQFRGDGHAGVGHWIRRIAINKALSQLRSPWFRRRIDVVGCEPAAEEPVGESAAQPTELERALAGLGATARSVVWLYIVEGYTHEEIGRLMGRSTSFSKTQFSRACHRLRGELQPESAKEEFAPCLSALKTV
jgi:RNA polymerase sigma-70 factor (ECF subfamily)